MANKFQLKRTTISGRTPNTTNSANTSFIDAGELAINLTDGILYSSNGSVAFQIGANLTSLNVGGSVTITGNLTVNGTSTAVSTRNVSLIDNMIYLNEPMAATVTGAVGNGTVVIYTADNTYAIGDDVTITGMNPSSFNVTANNITAANSTTFSVASTVTDSFVSGGTAYAKTDVNPDLGISGGYNDGTYRHAGFFRDATDGKWKVFDQYTPEPSGPFIDTANNTFRIADFQANGVFAANGEFTSVVKLGSNVTINTSALFVGNSSVNTVITSSTLSTANVNVTGSLLFGGSPGTNFYVATSNGTVASWQPIPGTPIYDSTGTQIANLTATVANYINDLYDVDTVSAAPANNNLLTWSNTALNWVPSSTIDVTTIKIGGNQAVNGPAFSAYANNTLQSITSGSQQKVLFQVEEFDTNNNYASSRFTPTVAGYYQLNAEVRFDGSYGTGETMIVVWKNGSEYKRGWNASGVNWASNFGAMTVSTLVYANGTTDYFEIYVQQTSGGTLTVTAVNNPAITWFNGAMVRGA